MQKNHSLSTPVVETRVLLNTEKSAAKADRSSNVEPTQASDQPIEQSLSQDLSVKDLKQILVPVNTSGEAPTPKHLEGLVVKIADLAQPLYRDLTWRNCDDPYAVLVSEVMLQQTQVARVERFWSSWMKLFPTLESLASASKSDVLEQWQGLGYNRRALALKSCAEQVVAQGASTLPCDWEALVALPGIGPATAAGVLNFAYQRPAPYIETNVRSVFIHELFSHEEKLSDTSLRPWVEGALGLIEFYGLSPREWNYALLDWGSMLKKQLVNPTRKSSTYTRQTKFEGSFRQKRSVVLRHMLTEEEDDISAVYEALCTFERKRAGDSVDRDVFERLVHELVSEGFLEQAEGLLRIARG